MTDAPSLDQPLVWVDLEMTGLDPARHVIVEIAVIVTDGALDVVAEGPDIVVAQPPDALAAMEPVVARMHAASGLTDEVRRSTTDLAGAQERVLAFVRRHVPESGTAPLAGNSIHADRLFLRSHMPELDRWLHYRNVDVSTIKELCRRWYPQALDDAPPKGGGHRALVDIQESITELRHYRATIFR